MDPTLASADEKEQRLLAAIVFTDVVGFSRLAAKNEARVYVSLQRDMAVMTDLCRAHNGNVLNTMGDGMLMCFTSAVDAMAAAVEIQRTLAAQAASLPASDVLHHRIGVHLGDVIMKGGNVFGDGVNTAARLQNDARPDSIWYSHTVHDVIKNKLKLDTKSIGKRQFKNLGEPVSVWEIPPVSEVRAQLQADSLGLNVPAAAASSDGVAGGKAFLLVLISVLMIGGVVFLATKMKPPKEAPPSKSAGPSKGTSTKVDPQTDPVPSGVTGTTTGGGTSTETGGDLGTGIVSSEAIAHIESLKQSYSFVEIVDYLSREGSHLPDAPALVERFTKLAQLRAWMEAVVQTSTASDMIEVQLSNGPAEIYNQPPVMIQFNKAGFVPFSITELSEGDFHTLGQALQSRPAAMAPAEVSEWLSIFAAEYAKS
jgi:class 3 adenylate cyclase